MEINGTCKVYLHGSWRITFVKEKGEGLLIDDCEDPSKEGSSCAPDESVKVQEWVVVE